MKMTETYLIHDNGGRPFKVEVSADRVVVFQGQYTEEDSTWYYVKEILEFCPQRIFIGKSPLNKMTEFSGGHGPKFDGNSILLHLQGLDYVHIGEEIYQFKVQSEIEDFVSHVGNNDVPYPYAVDAEGRYYLLLEKVAVEKVPSKYADDPYSYYYAQGLITADLGYVPPKQPRVDYFQGIREFYIGGEPYTLRYDRIAEWDDFGVGMELVKVDGRHALSRDEYVKVSQDFGRHIGVSGLRGVKVL